MKLSILIKMTILVQGTQKKCKEHKKNVKYQNFEVNFLDIPSGSLKFNIDQNLNIDRTEISSTTYIYHPKNNILKFWQTLRNKNKSGIFRCLQMDLHTAVKFYVRNLISVAQWK